jgi:predicted nucleotidyltransferase component of viral defense system
MIDKETLQKIAKLHNLRPWQQEKHYVQSIMLVALSEHPLLFKGGTYLWLFHGLPRFSEDLGFTCAEEVPQDLPGRVSESLRLFGMENTARREKAMPQSFAFRISAKGPLNTGGIDICHVYVEISRRETPMLPPEPFPFAQPQYSLPSKLVSGMALGEVAAEKVRAIMTRDKARDLYDLAYLIENKGVRFSEGMANAKLSHYGLKYTKKAFLEKMGEKEEYWKSELKPIVFKELAAFEEAERMARKWVTLQ